MASRKRQTSLLNYGCKKIADLQTTLVTAGSNDQEEDQGVPASSKNKRVVEKIVLENDLQTTMVTAGSNDQDEDQGVQGL